MKWMYVWAMCLTGFGFSVASETALMNAAGTGNMARVKELVTAGADVNAKSRYQATALSFAAEKGHREVVQFLIANGADVDVKDSFYHVSPLGWALSKGDMATALMLLPHGKMDHDMALVVGLMRGDEALVKAVLAQGPLEETTIRVLQAGFMTNKKMAALLADAQTRPDDPAITLDQKVIDGYLGQYVQQGGSGKAEFFMKDNQLHVTVMDETNPLEATNPRTFRVPGNHAKGAGFYGRGDSIEGVRFIDGMNQMTFSRADDPLISATKAEADQAKATIPVKTYARKPPINWSGFRGPAASGRGDGQNIPTQWDLESGQNIRWKTAIPGLGHSSPVVWGKRVYLTTAVSGAGNNHLTTGQTGTFEAVKDDSEHTWMTLCLDTQSGKILWEHVVGKAIPKTQRHLKATQANATPVTDGIHLVTVFPTVGMICYNMNGKVLWQHDLGGLDSGWFYDKSYSWGFSSSPVIYENTVILQVDIQEDPYIAAWDLASGKQVWKTPRDEIPTWATPNIYQGPTGDELIANGTTIRAYDPKTGKELWQLGPNSEVIIATPLVENNLIYVTAGYPPARPIYAVKPGGRGDISPEKSEQHIAWRHEYGGAYMPSPIIYEGLYYIGHHKGRLVSYDALTGEIVYKRRFSAGGTLTGSPVASDGRLYFTTEEGQVYVVQAGRDYKELAVIDMNEVMMTTPAISDGTLYLRTAGHLYAIGHPQ